MNIGPCFAVQMFFLGLKDRFCVVMSSVGVEASFPEAKAESEAGVPETKAETEATVSEAKAEAEYFIKACKNNLTPPQRSSIE